MTPDGKPWFGIWNSQCLMGKVTISMAMFKFTNCLMKPGWVNPLKSHWTTIKPQFSYGFPRGYHHSYGFPMGFPMVSRIDDVVEEFLSAARLSTGFIPGLARWIGRERATWRVREAMQPVGMMGMGIGMIMIIIITITIVSIIITNSITILIVILFLFLLLQRSFWYYHHH